MLLRCGASFCHVWLFVYCALFDRYGTWRCLSFRLQRSDRDNSDPS
uniref:Uncharacterized protein n=1 Tax=Arundo donax TaxID=35708 RepID=A0A0A9FWH8_ARUDO